jgi:hypothetical protein
LLELAEEALKYMRKASRGFVDQGDLGEPGIRKDVDWQILYDKAKKAIGILDDLHQRMNYTLVTELSLYSMERLAEAAVKKTFYVSERLEHGRIFEEAAKLEIIDSELASYLSRLFRYRSQLYYRSGIGTKELSVKLIELSKEFQKLIDSKLK